MQKGLRDAGHQEPVLGLRAAPGRRSTCAVLRLRHLRRRTRPRHAPGDACRDDTTIGDQVAAAPHTQGTTSPEESVILRLPDAGTAYDVHFLRSVNSRAKPPRPPRWHLRFRAPCAARRAKAARRADRRGHALRRRHVGRVAEDRTKVVSPGHFTSRTPLIGSNESPASFLMGGCVPQTLSAHASSRAGERSRRSPRPSHPPTGPLSGSSRSLDPRASFLSRSSARAPRAAMTRKAADREKPSVGARRAKQSSSSRPLSIATSSPPFSRDGTKMGRVPSTQLTPRGETPGTKARQRASAQPSPERRREDRAASDRASQRRPPRGLSGKRRVPCRSLSRRSRPRGRRASFPIFTFFTVMRRTPSRSSRRTEWSEARVTRDRA